MVRMDFRSFEALASADDDAIDVAVGAALIAKDFAGNVDVDAVLARLDVLAEPLVAAKLGALPPRAQAEAVSGHFRMLGFRGNVDDYYAPENSLLPDVLERRTGIPITLSIVWCELARRAGVLANGVGFPGHFLVRVDARDEDDCVIVDPFGAGRLLDDAAAAELLARVREGTTLDPSLFGAARPRDILVRMLGNLKAIWAHRGEHAPAFMAIDRMLALLPDSPKLLRERAAVALLLRLDDLAGRDIARVVALEPEAPDVPDLKRRLAALASAKKKRPPTVN